MNNLGLSKTMYWATVALIVPILGELFVDGWNWGVSEFIFAWVFFVVMGTSIKLAMRQISNPKLRVLVGILVFLLFAFIWGILATG